MLGKLLYFLYKVYIVISQILIGFCIWPCLVFIYGSLPIIFQYFGAVFRGEAGNPLYIVNLFKNFTNLMVAPPNHFFVILFGGIFTCVFIIILIVEPLFANGYLSLVVSRSLVFIVFIACSNFFFTQWHNYFQLTITEWMKEVLSSFEGIMSIVLIVIIGFGSGVHLLLSNFFDEDPYLVGKRTFEIILDSPIARSRVSKFTAADRIQMLINVIVLYVFCTLGSNVQIKSLRTIAFILLAALWVVIAQKVYVFTYKKVDPKFFD